MWLVRRALGDAGTEVSAKTVNAAPYGADADIGFDGGVVLGSRVGDKFHFLDVGGGEAFQFGVVLQKAVVYIYDRCAFAEDGVAFLFRRTEPGDVLQYIVGIVQRGEQGLLYFGFEVAAFQFEDGAGGGYYGFFE